MTEEPEHPEEGQHLPGEHFAETVQEIGPWRVAMLWPLDTVAGAGGPRSIHIEPRDGADSQEVARGITTTILRRVDIAAAAKEVENFAPWAQIARGAVEDLQQRKVEEFRQRLAALPKGVSDEYLAVISDLYVRIVEAGHRAPLQELETWTGTKQATLKGHLRAARQRGFLTKVEGKAGGRLTDKAITTLKGIDVEDAPQP
ncbi:hypothetical protein ACFWAT_23630 [Streptomyces syringium]|uniref:hypothetical protein n=1 Tax=Streptomyces syringium TaxID=76729 RepID=UPI003666501F